jgi:hypothetical protein
MIRFYPVEVEPCSVPPLTWPKSTRPLGQVQTTLYWVAGKPDNPPEWYPQDLGEVSTATTEGTPEGELVGAGETYRPFFVHTCEAGWWTVDALSGKPVAGQLDAEPVAARNRLALFTALGVFLIFSGGSLLTTLCLMVVMLVGFSNALSGGSAELGKLVGFIFGLLSLIWVAARMSNALPAALHEPLERYHTDLIKLPVRQEWRGMFSALGLVLGSLAALMFLAGLGTKSILVLMAILVQASVGGRLAFHLWKEGQGQQLVGARELPGEKGELVALALRVGLFAYCGSTLAILCGLVFNVETQGTLLAATGGQFGAILAVLLTKTRDGVGLIAGLLVNAVGEILLGPWVALVMAAATVALASGDGGLRRSWGFAVGLVSGRLLGRLAGLLMLGPGGVTVGEVLVQQVLAVTGWRVTGQPLKASQASA